MPYGSFSAVELAGKVRSQDFSLADLQKAVVENCGQVQKKETAFAVYDPEIIAGEIKQLEGRRGSGDSLPLAGTPFAVADNICTAGIETTAGSPMLAGYRPLHDAEVVRRLREAGAVLAGKVKSAEFGLGNTAASIQAAEACAGGAVEVLFASDTRGELRQAAACAGVMSLKPSYGRIPRRGLIGYASSLDHIGLMGRSAADLALALEHTAGYLETDPTSLQAEVPSYVASLNGKPGRLKAVIPAEWADVTELDGETAATFKARLQELKELGMKVDYIPLPSLAKASITARYISAVEAFSDLSNYDGVRFGYRGEAGHLQEMYIRTRSEGLGSKLKKFLTFGALVSTEKFYEDYFRQAQKMRALVKKELRDCFASYDLLITPVLPRNGFDGDDKDEASICEHADYYTAAANLAGLPAVTVPLAGENDCSAIQFMGNAGDESVLLNAALLLEEEGLAGQNIK